MRPCLIIAGQQHGKPISVAVRSKEGNAGNVGRTGECGSAPHVGPPTFLAKLKTCGLPPVSWTDTWLCGLKIQQQFVVNPPSWIVSPLIYRRYDLYNSTFDQVTGGMAQAWELKVGYQSASQSNLNQITFDARLLPMKSAGYAHSGRPVDITRIMWWEAPRTGGSVGLSPNLANALRTAVNATKGQFFVEVDFPYDDEIRPALAVTAGVPSPGSRRSFRYLYAFRSRT